jgi:hypothetical protein
MTQGRGRSSRGESGPDFMVLMSSREYEGLLINEFVIQRSSFGLPGANQANGAKVVAPLRPVLTSDVAAMPPSGKGSLAPIGMGVVQSIKTLGGVGQRGNVAMDELSELLPTITCVGLLALFLVFEAVRH